MFVCAVIHYLEQQFDKYLWCADGDNDAMKQAAQIPDAEDEQ